MVRRLLLCALTIGAGGIHRPVRADMVDIVAVRDTTLYTDPHPFGPRANSLGDYFFAGMTAAGNPGQSRRAIMAFDVASFVPAGATIEGAVLTVSVNQVPGNDPNIPAHSFSLHVATTTWTEGGSDAPGTEGTGADPTPGDATWQHSDFPGMFWSVAGGDFVAAPSATIGIGYVGFYQFSSSQMAADVQVWLDNPASDFGWFLLGDETRFASARRFDSRNQANNPDGWPVLTVEFTPVPEPGVLVSVAAGALLLGCVTRWRSGAYRRRAAP